MPDENRQIYENPYQLFQADKEIIKPASGIKPAEILPNIKSEMQNPYGDKTLDFKSSYLFREGDENFMRSVLLTKCGSDFYLQGMAMLWLVSPAADDFRDLTGKRIGADPSIAVNNAYNIADYMQTEDIEDPIPGNVVIPGQDFYVPISVPVVDLGQPRLAVVTPSIILYASGNINENGFPGFFEEELRYASEVANAGLRYMRLLTEDSEEFMNASERSRKRVQSSILEVSVDDELNKNTNHEKTQQRIRHIMMGFSASASFERDMKKRSGKEDVGSGDEAPNGI
jgi:hypothetical protein